MKTKPLFWVVLVVALILLLPSAYRVVRTFPLFTNNQEVHRFEYYGFSASYPPDTKVSVGVNGDLSLYIPNTGSAKGYGISVSFYPKNAEGYYHFCAQCTTFRKYIEDFKEDLRIISEEEVYFGKNVFVVLHYLVSTQQRESYFIEKNNQIYHFLQFIDDDDDRNRVAKQENFFKGILNSIEFFEPVLVNGGVYRNEDYGFMMEILPRWISTDSEKIISDNFPLYLTNIQYQGIFWVDFLNEEFLEDTPTDTTDPIEEIINIYSYGLGECETGDPDRCNYIYTSSYLPYLIAENRASRIIYTGTPGIEAPSSYTLVYLPQLKKFIEFTCLEPVLTSTNGECDQMMKTFEIVR